MPGEAGAIFLNQPTAAAAMKQKPACETVIPWLKANLGKNCLAPLTSTDYGALRAAVQCAELWVATGSGGAAKAFFWTVTLMQSKVRHLAYHAVAHCGEWTDRSRLWAAADLSPLEKPGVCACEPGGAERE